MRVGIVVRSCAVVATREVYRPEDGTWEVMRGAQAVLGEVRKQLGEDEYALQKRALQEFLCHYFSTGRCLGKLGCSISPISGPVPASGKCLKVRWAMPGGGKSGGLRLAVVVYCEQRRVQLAGAWIRRDDPSNADFEEAFSGG